MFTIDLVILTKSSKRGKFCVAGIDLRTQDWVRLISSNDDCDGAVSDAEMRTRDGYVFKPFDVAKVTVTKHSPIGCQSENYVISCGHPWQLLGTMTLDGVLQFCSLEKSQFIYGNTRKYIPSELINDFSRSLLLAEISDMKVYKNDGGKQKCSFKYNGYNYYDISVTDPDYYKYSECEIKKAYIVVSLPHTDYEGKYYKFVAKIFPVTPVVNKNPIYALLS